MAVSNPSRVIVELDTGIDDAYAVALLVSAEKIGLIIIQAIICSLGNTAVYYTCKNTVRLLETLGRTDIPVYQGPRESILLNDANSDEYFGVDGFGDLDHTTQPNLDLIRRENAATALNDLIIAYPGEISIIVLGPLTNLALTVKLYEGFVENIRDVWIMGGNYKGVGNISPSAEFNFYVDPEAAFAYLESTKVPVNILPLECCQAATLTLDWRLNVLGRINNSFIELLNRAEESFYNMQGIDSWEPCDAQLVATFLDPSIVKSESQRHVTVELRGEYTRGQVVVDHLHQNEPNARIIEEIFLEDFQNILVTSVGRL